MLRLFVLASLVVTATLAFAEEVPPSETDGQPLASGQASPDQASGQVSGQASAEAESVEQAIRKEEKGAQQELEQLETAVGKTSAGAGPASAGDSREKTGVGAEEAGRPWSPEARDFDWVQLTSGEWLKGEIKSMYKDSLEFDSDKLDLLDIDWSDVRFLKSHQPIQVNFDGHAPVTGYLRVSSQQVYISHDYGDEEYRRKDLVSLSPAGEREIDLWAIKYTLGLNVRRGNTNQIDYTSKFAAKRRTAKTRFVIDYIGNISKTNAGDGSLIETVNNHRVSGFLDVYASRYFYYTPIHGELYRDPFQNIDQRVMAGVGLGYTIFDTAHLEWNVSGGPAYVTIKYISVQSTDSQRSDSGALMLGTDVDTEISSKLDFIFKYNMQLAREVVGGYSHHMIATIENEITGRLDIDVSFIWDRTSQTTRNEQGERPEPDDYRLVLGITYTY